MFWNQSITLEIYLYLKYFICLCDTKRFTKTREVYCKRRIVFFSTYGNSVFKGIFFSSVMSISKNNGEVAGSGESLDSNRIHCQRGLTRCEFDFVFQKRESVAISLRVWHSLVQLLIKSPLAIV